MTSATTSPVQQGQDLAEPNLLRLVIEAYAPGGRWYVTSHLRRDRPAWPPSPDTLFSALVASAAAQGEPRDSALYWLEALEMLAIEAERAPATSSRLSHVPVADRPAWEHGAHQPRHICSICCTSPVRWSWVLEEDPDPRLLARLDRIAAGIPYLGSSRGLVVARARASASPLPDQALVRVPGGPVRLRTPFPGRLDELEGAFRLGQRARLAPDRAYARAAEVVRDVPSNRPLLRAQISSPWTGMIPLRKLAGPSLTLAATLSVTAGLRTSLLAHLGDDAPVTLSGHAGAGQPAAQQHLAFVPLARVGDRYADGEIMGIGLVPPGDLSEDSHAHLVRALGSWLRSGGTVAIGALRWQLGLAQDAADRGRLPRALLPDRYVRAVRTWSTMTPVAFDRHPKRHRDGRFKRGRSIHELGSAMCAAAGVPAPEHVEALPAPAYRGAVTMREHSLGDRPYLRSAFVSHLRLRWRTPVPGPILLGRGRHFGIGVLLPEDDPEDRVHGPRPA